MTHIITGPAGSGKTAALYELLKNDSQSRILLVPDQFVFESERPVSYTHLDVYKRQISFAAYGSCVET